MLDLPLVLSFIHAHKWALLAAVVIGFVARLSKDDAIGPTVPARWRPLFVLGLGAVITACDAIVAGQPTPDAIVLGLGSAITAILGHTVVVHSLRGGRELPLGPLARKTPPPRPPTGPSNPPSLPRPRGLRDGDASGPFARAAVRPPPRPPRFTALCAALVLVVACHAPAPVIEAGIEAGCTLIEAVTSSGAIKTICATASDIATIVAWIAAKQAADAGPPAFAAKCRQLSANGVTVCASDDDLAMAIDVVTAQRAAQFRRDAGGAP